MPSSMHIASDDVFYRLQQAFVKVAASVEDILPNIDRALHRYREVLEERLAECEARMRQLREAAEYAEDHDEVEQLIEQFQQLADKRRRIQSALLSLEEARNAFRRNAAPLHELATTKTAHAEHLLGQLHADLQAYLSVSIPGGDAPSTAPIMSAISTTATATSAARQTGDGSFCWVSPSTFTLQPDETIESLSWDRGYTQDECGEALQRLERLRPLVNIDACTSPENARLERYRLEDLTDPESGKPILSPQDSRALEAVFSEPIRIDVKDGEYDIINGRHRLLIAQQYGIPSLPVYFSEGAKALFQQRSGQEGQ